MGLFSDNFYTWLDRRYARTVSDEESMPEHDRHYHPNGFNPKTDSCNKREEEKDTDSVEKDNPPFTEETLKSRFGIKVHPFSLDIYGEEAKSFTIDELRQEWDWYATEPKKEARDSVIQTVGKVLDDIENRIGGKIEIDNLLVAEFLPTPKGFISGLSLADKINTRESIIAIATNKPEWDGKTYGHKGNRYIEDIVRHEIGHVLTTQKVIDNFHKILMEIKETQSRAEFVKKVTSAISNYGMESGVDLEAIAEIFSKVTDSDYKRGAIDRRFEELVIKDMLGGRI